MPFSTDGPVSSIQRKRKSSHGNSAPSAQTGKLPVSADILSTFPLVTSQGSCLILYQPLPLGFVSYTPNSLAKSPRSITLFSFPYHLYLKGITSIKTDSTTPWLNPWPSTPSPAFEPLISVNSTIPSQLHIKTWVIHEISSSLTSWIQSIPKFYWHCFLKVSRISPSFHSPAEQPHLG